MLGSHVQLTPVQTPSTAPPCRSTVSEASPVCSAGPPLPSDCRAGNPNGPLTTLNHTHAVPRAETAQNLNCFRLPDLENTTTDDAVEWVSGGLLALAAESPAPFSVKLPQSDTVLSQLQTSLDQRLSELSSAAELLEDHVTRTLKHSDSECDAFSGTLQRVEAQLTRLFDAIQTTSTKTQARRASTIATLTEIDDFQHALRRCSAILTQLSYWEAHARQMEAFCKTFQARTRARLRPDDAEATRRELNGLASSKASTPRTKPDSAMESGLAQTLDQLVLMKDAAKALETWEPFQAKREWLLGFEQRFIAAATHHLRALLRTEAPPEAFTSCVQLFERLERASHFKEALLTAYMGALQTSFQKHWSQTHFAVWSRGPAPASEDGPLSLENNATSSQCQSVSEDETLTQYFTTSVHLLDTCFALCRPYLETSQTTPPAVTLATRALTTDLVIKIFSVAFSSLHDFFEAAAGEQNVIFRERVARTVVTLEDACERIGETRAVKEAEAGEGSFREKERNRPLSSHVYWDKLCQDAASHTTAELIPTALSLATAMPIVKRCELLLGRGIFLSKTASSSIQLSNDVLKSAVDVLHSLQRLWPHNETTVHLNDLPLSSPKCADDLDEQPHQIPCALTSTYALAFFNAYLTRYWASWAQLFATLKKTTASQWDSSEWQKEGCVGNIDDTTMNQCATVNVCSSLYQALGGPITQSFLKAIHIAFLSASAAWNRSSLFNTLTRMAALHSSAVAQHSSIAQALETGRLNHSVELKGYKLLLQQIFSSSIDEFKSVLRLSYDTLMNAATYPIMLVFKIYAGLRQWATETVTFKSSKQSCLIRSDSCSLQPTPTVTVLGEYLLSLLPHLEESATLLLGPDAENPESNNVFESDASSLLLSILDLHDMKPVLDGILDETTRIFAQAVHQIKELNQFGMIQLLADVRYIQRAFDHLGHESPWITQWIKDIQRCLAVADTEIQEASGMAESSWSGNTVFHLIPPHQKPETELAP